MCPSSCATADSTSSATSPVRTKISFGSGPLNRVQCGIFTPLCALFEYLSISACDTIRSGYFFGITNPADCSRSFITLSRISAVCASSTLLSLQCLHTASSPTPGIWHTIVEHDVHCGNIPSCSGQYGSFQRFSMYSFPLRSAPQIAHTKSFLFGSHSSQYALPSTSSYSARGCLHVSHRKQSLWNFLSSATMKNPSSALSHEPHRGLNVST
mmetsp:Transcript_7621/g.16238  ORF Transcript_7621/g.16238 Transcript_7621/m.16238 type:complete len:212 (-) Transcript_7621:135-770(-)